MAMFLFFCWLLIRLTHADYPYKEGFFDQYVDHFNLKSYGNMTFKQRYLYQDQHWDRNGGPILFYAGNEGSIEDFWTATGFMHELAPEFKAYVIFIEHRYYGQSLPFGNLSFQNSSLGLLTVEQTMADFAILLTDLKERLNATDTKIISFGGSYGGLLAAYMRLHYPNIIDGSLASSVPILLQANDVPKTFFFQYVTQIYRNVSENCYLNVKKAFQHLNQLADSGPEGFNDISKSFRLSTPVNNQSYQHFLGWIRNGFATVAMANYPYPADFMGSLPANPVKVSCELILNSSSPMEGLSRANDLFYNSSATSGYHDIHAEFIECSDPTGCFTGNDAIAWDFQACTELILPSGSNNVTDMFPVLPWTEELRKAYCQETYGVTPRNEWSNIHFWGSKIQSSNNIIFSNGDLDPWMPGGINKDISNTIVAVAVVGGAHHADLRSSDPRDPVGVVEARKKEREIIRSWLTSQKVNIGSRNNLSIFIFTGFFALLFHNLMA